MFIRKAWKTDAAFICRLQQQLFEENIIYGFVPGTEDEIAESLDSYFLIAEIDSEIIGFISGTIHSSDNLAVIPAGASYLEIDNLYVNEKYRRQGVGGNLVDSLLAEAKQNGIHYSLLYSATKDIRSILKFYEQHNFQSWYVQMFQKL